MKALFSISSGLYAGWAIGANDTSGILGPAIGSKMLTFRPVAIICAFFMMAGAMFGGTGVTQVASSPALTAGDAFVVALSAALGVTLMTLLRCPVSTVQALTGAVIGWSIASETALNAGNLTTLSLVWVVSPFLSAFLAVCLYKLVAALIKALHVNIFKLDRMIRTGLFLACAFASYQLGANNIPATVGIFLPASPFVDLTLFGNISVSAEHQLLFLGGTAAAFGVFTWGRRMAEATGNGDFRFSSSPLMAMIAVLTQGLVFYLFTSQASGAFFTGHGLPALPMVPLSGYQCLVGAMMGLSFLNKGVTFSWRSAGFLTASWIATPALAFFGSYAALTVL
ncbi:anion permease [Desulfoluna limicola]|uniref:Anion permease n=1 Tax=Desulfoluna limicola TaxID=2810562 RepID=A0ABN6F2N8_9BACT|nr:inorganic phosphate transporter [Desulfoluna limicola]BCS95732.1 anion permease [Desulfoluna limicola]